MAVKPALSVPDLYVTGRTSKIRRSWQAMAGAAPTNESGQKLDEKALQFWRAFFI
jgi:hypothetical protein